MHLHYRCSNLNRLIVGVSTVLCVCYKVHNLRQTLRATTTATTRLVATARYQPKSSHTDPIATRLRIVTATDLTYTSRSLYPLDNPSRHSRRPHQRRSTPIKILHISSCLIPSPLSPRPSLIYRGPIPSPTGGGRSRLICSRKPHTVCLREGRRNSSGMSTTFPPHNPTSYRPANCRKTGG